MLVLPKKEVRHAMVACCRLLLGTKCAVPTDPHGLTASYSGKAEPLVKECLKKLGQEYAVAIQDIEV